MTNTSTEGGQEPHTEQGAGQGQEPPANGTEGQEPGGQATDQAPNVQTMDPSTIQDPALRSYVEKVQKDAKEAREEAARYRTRAATAESQVNEFQRQNETAEQAAQREAQEKQERLDALERENRDLKVGTAVRAAATAAKAFNPNLVTDMLQAKVTLGEDGKPTNLDDLLKDLRKSDPYLFRRQANQDAGEGQGEGGSPGQSMNDRIRAARQGIR